MNTDRNIPAPLLEDALDRLLRQQQGDGAGLAEWLAASDEHRRAFGVAQRSWDILGELPRAPIAIRPTPAPAPVRRPRRWVAGLALAASIAAVLLVNAPAIMVALTASHQTGIGETRTLLLADGTSVTLSADSAIADHVDDAGRSVRLLKGEAFFDVAHDPARPFVVDAGGIDVTVLGTAFDVRLSGDAAVVELARGAVAVSRDDAPLARLAPGDSVTVASSGEVSRGTVSTDDIGMWRSGQLFVDGVTVGEVVARLQRYHRSWITLPDAELAARTVTGLYDLSDPDRALRALVQPFGGHVHEVSPLLRIVTRL